ncbi:MAG: AAA family ATPase [Candidatus Aenigmarchaeota archaeon]|nr:AAA family ATPase [Candidatus Aenigmarchaeota archaeon]
MELKSIRLQNIRSYVNETLEFPDGSLLLAGDIGCGKSSVLLSIEFALFGIQRGELSGSDILRHGAKNGIIELHMKIDGKDVIVQRNVKREKKGVQVYCLYSSGQHETDIIS